MKKVWIYLENGTFLEANSFGAQDTVVGEIVFNVSMSGYQEIMSDPSYAGQFVTFTMPEIGNVGVNSQDMESKRAHAKGMIVRKYQERYSNFRAEDSLASFLKEQKVMGICDIDTRYLTKMLRNEGAMMMIASTEISDKAELKKILESSPRIEDVNYIEQVSTKTAYKHTQSTYNERVFEYDSAPAQEAKVVVLDFGVKTNILNELVNAKIGVEVIPNNFSADALIKRYNSKEIDGVFLSNGPGDPLVLKNEQEEIKKLIAAKIPMFGICLGHQLLSIAHGYDTYKLKFGHHGGNQPVKNVKTGLVEITAQNHNYNVPDNIVEIAEVTHVNLFDNTIEGLKYNNSPIFSVQHHPESSPGPKESRYIFGEFLSLIKR
ncbi:MAG: carbamoyl phosphate synthase small subunit [Sulfurimonas sp. RIFCSPLOWO2_12_FULL_36_74]|uniref:glutamine-hydrolyzing carbamoyl-phosphate synthase small subunit n=1 Tax=unclassified Sulfurimonas TaxID=2623549 RepID=UPI0008D51627|nr:MULTISPECIES: glutamine-hydrolyzing carbamoyl-phosphate synthase small subunit [unclassified Sulfurimonas]OHD99392.1 MAG: carbamoyl phosphate synthase small subunit [Sulfurimonas sp. RIFCSPLOWO2_02_FULL_36_28]OHE00268.1 MAG: carbamoyl phosphate synthase small subunit [Sulfurimonas sp. RIFCSPLOWO2_12_36_12]OHE07810.1 MAG: carbamoyl phosphate synthase small subunit [Sulfurimonas sp. RIFCSPLOWO2_12_FULL_36_74]